MSKKAIDKLNNAQEYIYQMSEGECPLCGQEDYPVKGNLKGYSEVASEDAEAWNLDHDENCPVNQLDQAIAILEKEPDRKEGIDIELISAEVHKAYCDERIRQGKEPYWTGGDYNKLDEATKDYDRATVKTILKAVALLEKEPQISEQEKMDMHTIGILLEQNKQLQEGIDRQANEISDLIIAKDKLWDSAKRMRLAIKAVLQRGILDSGAVNILEQALKGE